MLTDSALQTWVMRVGSVFQKECTVARGLEVPKGRKMRGQKAVQVPYKRLIQPAVHS